LPPTIAASVAFAVGELESEDEEYPVDERADDEPEVVSELVAGDPNKAVDNADSHEYFSENTPALN